MAWTERYVTVAGAGAHDGTSEASAWTLAEGITGEAAGQRVNIKAGTYANTTTTRTFAAVGTVTAPVWWRGYKTTIGDQDNNAAGVAGTDTPLVTFTTGQMVVSGAFHLLSNMSITSQCTTAGGAVNWTAASGYLYRARIENTAANSASRAMSCGASQVMVGCWLKATSSAPTFFPSSGPGGITGCYFDGGLNSVDYSTIGGSFFWCIFDSPTSDALVGTTGSPQLFSCSIYAPGGHGISKTGAGIIGSVNCHYENVNQASKAAINNSSGTNIMGRLVANSFYNNTANYSGITENFAIFDNGTLAGSGFIDAAGDDFRPSHNMRNLGFPGQFENKGLVGYPDIGAVQGVGGILLPPRYIGF